jgi:hypothetical protein
MSVEHELHEHTEHAHEPFDKKVAGTMAVLAAALAIVSVLGQLANTEELLNQQRASDQWAYYQAKSIRRYESEIARDLLAAVKGEKVSNYAANLERYQKEGEEVQKQAREFEEESHTKGREALRLHIGEVFVEVGIVFASLAILTKRQALWWVSIACGVVGLATAFTTALVH